MLRVSYLPAVHCHSTVVSSTHFLFSQISWKSHSWSNVQMESQQVLTKRWEFKLVFEPQTQELILTWSVTTIFHFEVFNTKPDQVFWSIISLCMINSFKSLNMYKYVNTSLTKEFPIELNICMAIFDFVKHSSSVNWIIWLLSWCPTWEIHPISPEESFWNITKSVSLSLASLKQKPEFDFTFT